MSAAHDDIDPLLEPDGRDAGRSAEPQMTVKDLELASKLATLFEGDTWEKHLDQRPDLVGRLPSHELLERDEEVGFFSEHLETDDDAVQMLFVDELRCVGCGFCSSIARSTFKLQDEFGTARVVQQGQDPPEVVDEAIDSCPADCIHFCSRKELRVLEKHRAVKLNELMMKWQTRRLAASGGIEGGMAVPHWRDALVHRGWERISEERVGWVGEAEGKPRL